MNKEFYYWKVSVSKNYRREYHYFSSLSKAQVFISHFVMDCVEDDGHPPFDQIILTCRNSAVGELPKIIDENRKIEDFKNG